MPIKLNCTNCSITFNVSEQFKDRKIKCPKCGQVLSGASSAETYSFLDLDNVQPASPIEKDRRERTRLEEQSSKQDPYVAQDSASSGEIHRKLSSNEDSQSSRMRRKSKTGSQELPAAKKKQKAEMVVESTRSKFLVPMVAGGALLFGAAIVGGLWWALLPRSEQQRPSQDRSVSQQMEKFNEHSPESKSLTTEMNTTTSSVVSVVPAKSFPVIPSNPVSSGPARPGSTALPTSPEKLPEIVLNRGGISGDRIYQRLLKSAAYVWVGDGHGSGSVVDAEHRLILTNYHVVEDLVRPIVFFPGYDSKGALIQDGKTYGQQIKDQLSKKADVPASAGTVVLKDVGVDLALIQLDTLPKGLIPLRFATNPRPGNNVFSIGNPGSGALWILSTGSIRGVYPKEWRTESGIHKATVVETQSPTNPGDSGGPLVNDRAELIGVTHGGSTKEDLRNYFIHVDEVKRFIDRYFESKGIKWQPKYEPEEGGDQLTVLDLIKHLDHPDATIRRKAIVSLKESGPEAAIAIPGLLKSLKDSDEVTSSLALQTLDKIPPTKAMVGKLAESLKDENAQVRIYASTALAKLGADAAPAASSLILAIKDSNARVRQQSVRALALAWPTGDSVIPLLDALEDSDADVVVAVQDTLGKVPSIKLDDVAILNQRLKSTGKLMRRYSALMVGKLGSQAKETLPALIDALKDEDVDLRACAAEAIYRIGPERDHVARLITHLNDDVVAYNIGRGIEKLGKCDVAHVPLLIETAKSSKSDQGKSSAIMLLAEIGPEAAAAIPLLQRLASDPNPLIRNCVAFALGSMGPAALESRAQLLELLQDKDSPTRICAATALGKLGPKAWSVAPALAKCLKDKNLELRKAALDALQEFGPDARLAAPQLIELLSDKEFQQASRNLLVKIGKRGVPPLIDALDKGNDYKIRLSAIQILKEIGPEAKEAVPMLTTLSKSDKLAGIRTEAVAALRTIQRSN